jgi:hypothetical protein
MNRTALMSGARRLCAQALRHTVRRRSRILVSRSGFDVSRGPSRGTRYRHRPLIFDIAFPIRWQRSGPRVRSIDCEWHRGVSQRFVSRLMPWRHASGELKGDLVKIVKCAPRRNVPSCFCMVPNVLFNWARASKLMRWYEHADYGCRSSESPVRATRFDRHGRSRQVAPIDGFVVGAAGSQLADEDMISRTRCLLAIYSVW